MKQFIHISLWFTVIMLASCASKKIVLNKNTTLNHITHKAQQQPISNTQNHLFAQKVLQNQVYAQNIVGKISFRLLRGEKQITAPGALKMRKNKVIRLQIFIPLLGSEVGRIEFTPEGVLVIDRIHKEYVKATYNEIDFLRNNALNFYTLQALFWNQLMIPNKQIVDEKDLDIFAVNFPQKGANNQLTIQKGNMTYLWNANKTTAQITTAMLNYTNSNQEKSILTWQYSDFQNVGVKQFPTKQTFDFSIKKQTTISKNVEVSIAMDEVETVAGWQEHSNVSSRYRQVNAQDILSNLLK